MMTAVFGCALFTTVITKNVKFSSSLYFPHVVFCVMESIWHNVIRSYNEKLMKVLVALFTSDVYQGYIHTLHYAAHSHYNCVSADKICRGENSIILCII